MPFTFSLLRPRFRTVSIIPGIETGPPEPPKGAGPWRLAVVTGLDKTKAEIGFVSGDAGHIPMAELSWARPWLEGQKVGARPKRPNAVLSLGDVVLVEPVAAITVLDAQLARDGAADSGSCQQACQSVRE